MLSSGRDQDTRAPSQCVVRTVTSSIPSTVATTSRERSSPSSTLPRNAEVDLATGITQLVHNADSKMPGHLIWKTFADDYRFVIMRGWRSSLGDIRPNSSPALPYVHDQPKK